MAQRADFHRYDVLEHSFRCVRYAPSSIRLTALLHDVGKPYCFLRDGNFYAHPEEGARIAHDILTRLKAPKKQIGNIETLILLHMRDYDLKMRERKVKTIILEHETLFCDLLALKQADYSACKDDLSPAPCVVKWKTIYQDLKDTHIPLSVSQLAVNGTDLLNLHIPSKSIGTILQLLLRECALNGLRNEKNTLLLRAQKFYTKKENL